MMTGLAQKNVCVPGIVISMMSGLVQKGTSTSNRWTEGIRPTATSIQLMIGLAQKYRDSDDRMSDSNVYTDDSWTGANKFRPSITTPKKLCLASNYTTMMTGLVHMKRRLASIIANDVYLATIVIRVLAGLAQKKRHPVTITPKSILYYSMYT